MCMMDGCIVVLYVELIKFIIATTISFTQTYTQVSALALIVLTLWLSARAWAWMDGWWDDRARKSGDHFRFIQSQWPTARLVVASASSQL
jgi:hypothetical protein